jgi:hypothetical protein
MIEWLTIRSAVRQGVRNLRREDGIHGRCSRSAQLLYQHGLRAGEPADHCGFPCRRSASSLGSRNLSSHMASDGPAWTYPATGRCRTTSQYGRRVRCAFQTLRVRAREPGRRRDIPAGAYWEAGARKRICAEHPRRACAAHAPRKPVYDQPPNAGTRGHGSATADPQGQRCHAADPDCVRACAGDGELELRHLQRFRCEWYHRRHNFLESAKHDLGYVYVLPSSCRGY